MSGLEQELNIFATLTLNFDREISRASIDGLLNQFICRIVHIQASHVSGYVCVTVVWKYIKIIHQKLQFPKPCYSAVIQNLSMNGASVVPASQFHVRAFHVDISNFIKLRNGATLIRCYKACTKFRKYLSNG